jgi:hypothetical protein
MEPYNIYKTIDAYFLRFTAEKGTADYENSSWATDLVLDWEMEGDSDSLWEFILVAYKRELPDDLLAILAAGPLEDLLAKFGPAYIDRVEDLARTDPKFNRLLGGVWRNSMTEDVWQRVQAARTTAL